jgi:hypothetical protein
MTKLVFDYDPILYECGFIGEERHVKVVHRASGDEYEFPNRTAFYGHWKKKAGGWLAEYNAGRDDSSYGRRIRLFRCASASANLAEHQHDEVHHPRAEGSVQR